MRILIIGGTQFIGRHIVDELLNAGDEVTLFHRGTTNPELFPNLEHRRGDRNGNLSALAEGEWDATIDPSAYVPRQVHTLARALGARGGRYVHVSSASVYAKLAAPGANEDAAHVTINDPTTEVVDSETYGALKSLCEEATANAFGPEGPGWAGQLPSIVRPTYVAGSHDHTGRFTWWVQRIAQGGRVLAPGPRTNPFQIIDVRDVAAFVGRLAHGESQGVFHLAGPTPPFSFEDFLHEVRAQVGPPDTELVWVSAEELLAAGVTPGELPLWEALADNRYANALDARRALDAGLRIRPFAATIGDVYAHESRHATPWRSVVGMSAVRERELLAALA